jgi:hypothetical protein
MPAPALIHHYVHVTAALAADDASVASATAAAALWNGYYKSGSSLAPATVSTQVVDSFSSATTVGLASGYACPPGNPRHLCGPVTLSVRRGWETLFVDIFVHEIGHAVVFSDATAPGRVIDSSHHWNPAEPYEIFGPQIASPPWVAWYTIAGAGGGNVCAANSECSTGTCGAVPNFRRVPGMCVAAGAAAAQSTDSGAGSTGNGSSGSTTAIAVGVGVAVVVVVVVVAVVMMTATSRKPDSGDAAEALI